MKYLLLFLLASTAMAQAPLKKVNRALNEPYTIETNVSGVSTEAARFSGADCATSGATFCSGIYTPTIVSILKRVDGTDNEAGTPESITYTTPYFRMGNQVHACGRFRLDLASAESTDVRFTIPIARSGGFTAGDLHGVVTGNFSSGTAANATAGWVSPVNASLTDASMVLSNITATNNILFFFCFAYCLDC